MGCAASTPGPVAGSESGHAGSHPSSPSANPGNALTANSKLNGLMLSATPTHASPATSAQTSAKAAQPAQSALPKTEQTAEAAKQAPMPTNGTHRRRQSSEEFAATMNGPNAEPTFIPVTKGKVSDITFGVNEEVLRPRNRSQDDAGIMAQQLGLMMSSPLFRLDSDRQGSGARGGATRGGGGAGAAPPDQGKPDRASRAKMFLTRHTLDTAPGAQGVVRHKEWVTANGGRRKHQNVIESRPERIAGKKTAPLVGPAEERKLDRLEAKFLKETLAKHWLFEKFSDAQFSLLTKNCETVDLREGQPLIIQGAEDDGRMYILHRGTLSVHVLDNKKAPAKDAAGKDSLSAPRDPHAGRESADERDDRPPAAGSKPFERGTHVATVLSGGWVGDMALLYKTMRTATVIAEADSRVLAVPRLAYENVIAEGYEADAVDSSSNEFASVPVLSSVKDSNVLTQQGRATSWAAGDVLLESGSGARELLLITHGEVDFANRAGASPASGAEYRWSMQPPFVLSDRLRKGDVLAAGRPGDESLLVTLHTAGAAKVSAGSARKLKLAGGLPRGGASAVAVTDGKGYRFYLQDIVTHAPLIEPLVASLEGIRALLQCTPALANSLTAAGFDSASFVMKHLTYAPGQSIPVSVDRATGSSPLLVLVAGKVAVRREDDVAIRGENEPPEAAKPSDPKKPAVDEGIVARLYDLLTTATTDDQPGLKLTAKSAVSLLALSRADHADLASRNGALNAVRSYPPKRPPSSAAAFGGKASADGNSLKLSDISFERKIGQGAYGAVYLVVHKPTGKTLAAKIIKLARLRKHQKDDAINVERHVMQDSDNPFIVRLYATYKTRTHLLLVMEAGLGGELFSFLLRQEHQVLREDSVRFYGACVLSGLAAMHADGYMYRDLKPENVVITADGYCKIVDFGFAKRTAARTYTVCGTNAYLSPEMLTVQGHNFEVDYWAFGVFLYEMAIGCASFNVEADGTMNHEMPPFKVCQNILNANYKLRFDIGVYKISAELQNVITQLLERRVEHRIGCRVRGADEICDHPFFAPIDFSKLRRFEYQPPWNPELQNGLDTRYFESTHKMRKSELIAVGLQE